MKISIFVKTDSSSNGPSLRLSKRYALFWFYLCHIYNNDCNVIFDIHQNHKALISYLVMKFWGSFMTIVLINYIQESEINIRKTTQDGSPAIRSNLGTFRGDDLQRNS